MTPLFSKSTTVGVAGAGTMGSGIALVASAAGHSVVLFDSFPGAVERAQASHATTYQKLVEKGKISADESAAILSRITYTDDTARLSNAGIIIEAIIEDLSAKQSLFKTVESIVADNCVLASNTSSLSITSIAGELRAPSRCIGVHFFNPATLMPLVEIIPGLQTSSELTSEVRTLIDSWGKTTVLAKDTPGFIVNRVARPFYGESIRIYEEGWLDLPEGAVGMATIDWALREIGGFRMGPFELMDLIGNDINYTVTETVWKQLYLDPRYHPSLTQKRMVEAKRFGRKSGMGYFDYSANAVIPQPDKDPVRGRRIVDRVLAMLINEAADACYLKIAAVADIDLAMTKGVNYPKGLLQWCDELGAAKIISELEWLREEYAEERYRPSVLLKRMAHEGLKFHA
ncbi:MAG: hypothetical protein RIQ47_512 [Bacteroidota bacterium]|jgi:3-hydroxybutyryl-CoA dehydrogenase